MAAGFAGPPAVDFYSMLSGLGDTMSRNMEVKRKQLLDEGQKRAWSDFTTLDPSSPDYGKQALSIAQKLGSSGDQEGAARFLGLAQTTANRQQDMAWRQQESERAQRNADRSYGLQERAAARADQGPVETAAQRAAAARANGLDPASPQGRSYILTGSLPASDTSFQGAVEQRKAAAQANGLDPSSPGYQSFVLTGKMPREDAQPLTATDKKAILEADESVLANKSAIDALKKATQLSEQAFYGPTAEYRAKAAALLGPSSELGKSGIATQELNNVVTSNALAQLKATFGAAPTEGERKILLEIQGSVDQPPEVRRRIYARAAEMAQKRLEFNQQRADELRGGSFYKATGGASRGSTTVAAAAPAVPKIGELRDGYRFRGGDPADPNSWAKAAQ